MHTTHWFINSWDGQALLDYLFVPVYLIHNTESCGILSLCWGEVSKVRLGVKTRDMSISGFKLCSQLISIFPLFHLAFDDKVWRLHCVNVFPNFGNFNSRPAVLRSGLARTRYCTVHQLILVWLIIFLIFFSATVKEVKLLLIKNIWKGIAQCAIMFANDPFLSQVEQSTKI